MPKNDAVNRRVVLVALLLRTLRLSLDPYMRVYHDRRLRFRCARPARLGRVPPYADHHG